MENGHLGADGYKDTHRGWIESGMKKLMLGRVMGISGGFEEGNSFSLSSGWVLLPRSSQWVQLGPGRGQIWVLARPGSSAPSGRAKPRLGGCLAAAC